MVHFVDMIVHFVDVEKYFSEPNKIFTQTFLAVETERYYGCLHYVQFRKNYLVRTSQRGGELNPLRLNIKRGLTYDVG